MKLYFIYFLVLITLCKSNNICKKCLNYSINSKTCIEYLYYNCQTNTSFINDKCVSFIYNTTIKQKILEKSSNYLRINNTNTTSTFITTNSSNNNIKIFNNLFISSIDYYNNVDLITYWFPIIASVITLIFIITITVIVYLPNILYLFIFTKNELKNIDIDNTDNIIDDFINSNHTFYQNV
jgi:hypothetical protein